MKSLPRLLLPLALLLALTACAVPEPAPAPEPEPAPPSVLEEPVIPTPALTFTREELPRLDGSTSTAPLARAMCAVLLGEDVEAVTELIQFSRTTQSYRNLMDGEADLLLAAEPAPEVMAELEAGGQWTLTPFATDALVFVVNENNPVDGLTTEEVQKIYTGEITNWKEVGGEDLDIVPFQRNAEAGSQTMFEKLVMAGQPLMEPPLHWVSDSMSGLLESVREYDNSPAAIGYTVYYYANNMEMAKGLKVLAIDGVSPSAQAIRAGDYPFLNPYFVAVRSGLAEDAAAKRLYDWVLSPAGQEIVASEGYVPVLDTGTDVQTPALSPSLHPDVDGGRWWPQTVTDLIPGENYGPLYPYVGAAAASIDTVEWTEPDGTQQTWVDYWNHPVYGLMTREGKIVTDPGYQSVILPVSHYGGSPTPYPVLLLYRSDPEWESFTNGQRFAVCAREGDWCTGMEFWTYAMKDNCLLLLGVNGITHLDCASGARRDWSWAELGIPEKALPATVEYVMYAMGLSWTDRGACIGLSDPDDWENSQRLIFDPVTGELFTLSRMEWSTLESESHLYYWDITRNWTESRDLENVYIERDEKTYTIPLPEDLNILHNIDVRGDFVILADYSSTHGVCWLYRLSTGELLTTSSYISFLYDTADYSAPAYVRVEEAGTSQTLYTPEFTEFLTYDDPSVYFSYQSGMLTVRDDETFFAAYDGDTRECVFYRNLEMGD